MQAEKQIISCHLENQVSGILRVYQYERCFLNPETPQVEELCC